jgi:hypothetical protein
MLSPVIPPAAPDALGALVGPMWLPWRLRHGGSVTTDVRPARRSGRDPAVGSALTPVAPRRDVTATDRARVFCAMW